LFDPEDEDFSSPSKPQEIFTIRHNTPLTTRRDLNHQRYSCENLRSVTMMRVTNLMQKFIYYYK